MFKRMKSIERRMCWHFDTVSELTSCWEISVPIEDPILPFRIFPPPVMVPVNRSQWDWEDQARSTFHIVLISQVCECKTTPTSHLNDLSLQGHHPPPPVPLESHPGGLLHVLGHESVSEGKVKSWTHVLVLHLHHVKKPGAVLRSIDGSHVLLPHLHLHSTDALGLYSIKLQCICTEA